MATNHRDMHANAAAVWAALADGWTYADWVVGTRKIRDVDAGFPAKGQSIHYTLGRGPLRHDGHTDVESLTDGQRLELTIHAWPAAAVRVVLTVEARGANKSRVTMTEHPVSGPFAFLHNPLFDAVVKVRNIETLRRLDNVAQSKQ